MSKIVIRNTSIIINDYKMGDCPRLEDCFKLFEPLTHKFYYMGLYHDKDNNKLYLPRGLDLWKIKSFLNSDDTEIQYHHPFLNINNIAMKYAPRDEDQIEALKFTCGIDQYAKNAYLNQLSLNLNTGKGKTYVSIATIAFFKIKSIIITGSNSLLKQWKDEIVKYTNLNEDQIVQINGSQSISMIFSGKSNKYKNAEIYLCSHGTIRSFANQYGWDKIDELFILLGIGIKVIDEYHQNFENSLMIDFYTNVYKTYYVTATPHRSDQREDRIYQLSIKNVPAIDLFREDRDPHTSYIAIKWNSHPSPQQISACKNKYGLDRMKYIDYITQKPEFYDMMRIIMDLIIKCKGRVLLYIGTNEGILRVYHWICVEYNEFIGDVGIFSSLVARDQKLVEKNKKLLLSTTKSAGLGEHIEGLKMTIVLAEPFKSPVLARQTLGRTRDPDTMYIELVDVGFIYIKKFYTSKLSTFNKYATDVSDTFIDSYELNRRSQNIINKRKEKGGTHPIVFHDERFDFTNIENNITYNDESEKDENNLNIGNNPYLR